MATNLKTIDLISAMPKDFTPAQLAWLHAYLDSFKSEVLNECERKLCEALNLNANNNNATQQETATNERNLENNYYFEDNFSCTKSTTSLETRIKMLLSNLKESKEQERLLRAAYLEEELQSTGAFEAACVQDFNEQTQDGAQVEPESKFTKSWLLQNSGELNWSDGQFDVKLVNIGSNGSEPVFVKVPLTKPSEVARVNVDLIAPAHPGKYSSEWQLSCDDYTFGPRMWCSIEVVNEKDQYEKEKKSGYELNALDEKDEEEKEFKEEELVEEEKEAKVATNDKLEEIEEDDDEFVVVSDSFNLGKSESDENQQQQQEREEEANKENNNKVELCNQTGLSDYSTNASDIQVLSSTPSESGEQQQQSKIIGQEKNEENLFTKRVQTDEEKLISMGFSNAKLNERLLKKYNGDLDKLLQALLDNFDYKEEEATTSGQNF